MSCCNFSGSDNKGYNLDPETERITEAIYTDWTEAAGGPSCPPYCGPGDTVGGKVMGGPAGADCCQNQDICGPMEVCNGCQCMTTTSRGRALPKNFEDIPGMGGDYQNAAGPGWDRVIKSFRGGRPTTRPYFPPPVGKVKGGPCTVTVTYVDKDGVSKTNTCHGRMSRRGKCKPCDDMAGIGRTADAPTLPIARKRKDPWGMSADDWGRSRNFDGAAIKTNWVPLVILGLSLVVGIAISEWGTKKLIKN